MWWEFLSFKTKVVFVSQRKAFSSSLHVLPNSWAELQILAAIKLSDKSNSRNLSQSGNSCLLCLIKEVQDLTPCENCTAVLPLAWVYGLDLCALLSLFCQYWCHQNFLRRNVTEIYSMRMSLQQRLSRQIREMRWKWKNLTTITSPKVQPIKLTFLNRKRKNKDWYSTLQICLRSSFICTYYSNINQSNTE